MKTFGHILGSLALLIAVAGYMIFVRFTILSIAILGLCQILYFTGIHIASKYKIKCCDNRCIYNIKGRCIRADIELDEDRKCKSFDFE